MQRIERYGVIALVFLLVTILAVSLWGDKKGGSLFSFLKRKPRDIPSVVEPLSQGEVRQTAASDVRLGSGDLPLSAPASEAVPHSPVALASNQAAPGSAAFSQPAPLVSYDQSAARDGYSPGQLFGPQAGEPARVPNLPVTQRESLVDAAAVSAPRSVPAAGSVYVVKSGETLGDIAMAHLGTWRRWTEISALNDNIEPSKLRAGMKLTMPAAVARSVSHTPSTATRALAEPAAEARHKLQSGETMSKLAARYLGKAERWPEIAAANPGLDPNRLQVGAMIAIPSTSRRPGQQVPQTLVAERQRTAARQEDQPRALVAQAEVGSTRGRVR